MWEGGVVDHGGDGTALLPWLGPAAAANTSAAPLYMPPVVAAAAAPFVGELPAEEPFEGGYFDGGGGGVAGHNHHHHHQYGMFGMEAAAPPVMMMQMGGGGSSSSSRMVSGLLGTLQAELGRMTAKEIMDAKALAASRSHSEAERRRRQRINGHLARLRSLLPNTTKTDKASLLAEVIEHVKELKRQTSAMMEDTGEAAASPLLLPTEDDELDVDAAADEEGRLVARASLCCEDRADLIPDIARALAALRLRARRAEIATLGGRVRSVLLIAAVEEDDADEGSDDDDDEHSYGGEVRGVATSHRRHELVASIQEALRGVMDRKAASSDTSSSGGGGGGSIKRQRMISAHELQGSFNSSGW
uniref:BHLH domain-containing protein n=1 Tax=Oryza punctata TaxID=4537 RepID=A0A0E0LV54_ORYPU